MCKPVFKKTCVVCNKEFAASKPTVKTCSPKCKVESWRDLYAQSREERLNRERECKCVVCNKEFVVKAVRKKKFCSDLCFKLHQTKVRRAYYKREIAKADNYTTTCTVCGTQFTGKRIKKERKMCSDECRRKAQSQSVRKWRAKVAAGEMPKQIKSNKQRPLHTPTYTPNLALQRDVLQARNDVAVALRRLGL